MRAAVHGRMNNLLVNACSKACVERLPKPPPAYFQGPHRGGPEVRQPGQERGGG